MSATLRTSLYLLLFPLASTTWAANELQDIPREIHLSPGRLADVLDQLGEQSGLQIMYREPAPGRDITVPGVSGTLTVQDALTRVLADTGLQADRVNDKTVVLRLAQAHTSPPVAAAANPSTDTQRVAESQIEGITVTARKREERLQDVPASIAAASAETISQLNMVNVTELNAVAPGLTFVTNPSRFGSGPTIALRGVSTQTQGSGVQDSVAIVIDGVVIERAKAGAFPDLSDTQRIEILRGPQGTLFGKNASAGVISITTKDPTDESVSELAVDYGTYDNAMVRGAVSGPLIDEQLAGRLSVYRKSRDGYVENIYDGGKWEDDEQTGARGKLVFTPSDADTLKLSADYIEQKNSAGANVIRAFTSSTPQYVIDAHAGIVGPENDKINARPFGQNRQTAGGAALQWDRSIGEHTWTTLTAYRAYDQDFEAGTYTWLTPLNDGIQLGYTDQDQYSAETRIASPSGERFEYVAGLYALANDIRTGIYDPGTLVVGTTNRNSRNSVSLVETFNYAAFAEVNADATEQLTLTAGLRWTHEDVDSRVTGFPITPGYIRFGHPLGTTNGSATASKVSWKLGGQWRMDADRMFYASVATGFKGPGFNVNNGVLGDPEPVAPETSTSYELGMKTQYFDRRLTLNLNLFHTRFENFQTQGGFVEPGNVTARIILLNAQELRTEGVEAEFAAVLTDSLSINANVSYADAKFERFANAPCYPRQPVGANECVGNVQDLSGSRLPNAPRWNANLFGAYEFQIPNTSWDGFAHLNYSWRDDIQWNALGSPAGIEPGYSLLGAALGVRTGDDRLAVKLYGKNLTDKFHTSGIVVGQQIHHFLPPDYRRIFGVDVALKY